MTPSGHWPPAGPLLRNELQQALNLFDRLVGLREQFGYTHRQKNGNDGRKTKRPWETEAAALTTRERGTRYAVTNSALHCSGRMPANVLAGAAATVAAAAVPLPVTKPDGSSPRLACCRSLAGKLFRSWRPPLRGSYSSAVGSGVLRIATRARLQHCARWPGHVLFQERSPPQDWLGRCGTCPVPLPHKQHREIGVHAFAQTRQAAQCGVACTDPALFQLFHRLESRAERSGA
jgi:hypothetical protein